MRVKAKLRLVRVIAVVAPVAPLKRKIPDLYSIYRFFGRLKRSFDFFVGVPFIYCV